MIQFLNNGTTIDVPIQDLVIDPRLQHANVQPGAEEFSALEQQVVKEGFIRDPGVAWLNPSGQLLLVDGFTRRRIVLNNQAAFPDQVLKCYMAEFSSIEEAVAWITINQASRRNMTAEMRYYMIGTLYNDYKKNRPGLEAFLKMQGLDSAFSDDLERKTGEMLGSFFKVDEKTVRRYSKFAVGIERLKEKGDAAVTLVNSYLYGALRDDKGKHVNIPANVIEKLGDGERKPYKFSTVEDFKEMAKPKVEKEKKGKGEDLSKVLIKLVGKFVKAPTLDLKEELIEILDEYMKQEDGK